MEAKGDVKTFILDSIRKQHISAMLRRLTICQFDFNRPLEMAVFGARWLELSEFLVNPSPKPLPPIGDCKPEDNMHLDVSQVTKLCRVFELFGMQRNITNNQSIRLLLEIRELLGIDGE
jgi:hypothetical protein